jgi:hypothetical protein
VKEKVLKGILIEILIMDNLNMVGHMGKEFTHGITVKFMMDNGTKGSSKDTEYGKESKMILI